MRTLLFSNSTNAGEEYLSYTIPFIREFTGGSVKNSVFIPYAGVTIDWDSYSEMVSAKLKPAGISVLPIHKFHNPLEAIHAAETIIVGGGNTFQLLKLAQETKILSAIRQKVLEGTPYIGWSAGANLGCPTICTTNDMPITQPESFNALSLIPFQINPHYTDSVLQNHAGETREMRIAEFIKINTNVYVAGLREGTLFHIEGNSLQLRGNKNCRVFHHGKEAVEFAPGENISFLMQ